MAAEPSWYEEVMQQLNSEDVNTALEEGRYAEVLCWIAAEQGAHAGAKYTPDDEDERTRGLVADAQHEGASHALQFDSGWHMRAQNYLSRALTLGLENPLGRQALLKYASTAVALAASSIRLYGESPVPGVPSGVVK